MGLGPSLYSFIFITPMAAFPPPHENGISLPTDVEPVMGEDAKEYQAVIVEGVSKEFGEDEERLQEFVKQTRDYGKGSSTSVAFWGYLVGAFGKEKALIFLPKLARLIPEEQSRKALLQQPALEEGSLSSSSSSPSSSEDRSSGGSNSAASASWKAFLRWPSMQS